MERRHIRASDLLEMKFVADPRVSPDGSRVAFSLSWVDVSSDTYRSGIWIAPVDGSRPEKAFTNVSETAAPFHDRMPRWNPATGDLSFLSNRSGKDQVWCLPMQGGEARPLTVVEAGVSEYCWSPDGRQLAFVAREPRAAGAAENRAFRVINTLRYKANGVGYADVRPRYVWLLDVETGEAARITDWECDEISPVFSPDGNRLAFVSEGKRTSGVDLRPEVWVVELSTGRTTQVSDNGPCSLPAWSPCGEKIAYFANPDDISAANTRLYITSADGESKWVTADFDRSMGNSMASDIKYRGVQSGPSWAADGNKVYFVATDGGHAGLFSVSLTQWLIEGVVNIPDFSIVSFDIAQGMIAYCGGTHTNPGDVFVGPNHRRLTAVNDPLLSRITLSNHEKIEYEGDQGWPIEAWILKPANFQKGKKYPIVIQIHGGPASTVGEVFNYEYQLMAARGYGVFYMNFRGSKGYGEKFSRAIVGDRGGAEFRDIMLGADMLETVPWVDANRMYVTGGSFGGYETNWIVTQTNRFRAAVTQRSCSNIYSKIGTADNGFYHNVAYMAADLWEGEDFLMSRSPIRFAPQVETPILIVHSDQDLRLPLEQAEQWYTALKRLGKTEVEFVLFHGENHDLSRTGKPSNRIERLERIIGWFDRHSL